MQTLTNQLSRQQEAFRKVTREAETLNKELDSIMSGNKTPASLKAMESELSKLDRSLKKTDDRITELGKEFSNLNAQAKIEVADNGFASETTLAAIKANREEAAMLGKEFSKGAEKAYQLQNAVDDLRLHPENSVEAQRLSDRIATAEEKAERLSKEASQTADSIRALSESSNDLPNGPERAARAMSGVATNSRKATRELKKTTKASDGLGGSIERIRKRLVSLAAAALVFNVIRKGLRSLSSYLTSVLKTNQQFVNSLASIKGNLLTAFQPIYEAAIPALNALMNVLAAVTGYLAAFINLLFGKTISSSQGAAKSLYDQAKAYGAVGSAADKAAGKLASFDDLNVLGKDTGSSGGGGGAEVIAPEFDFSFAGDLADKLNEIVDVFRKAWTRAGEQFVNSFNRLLNTTKNLVQDIGDTLFEVWTNGTGEDYIVSILELLSTVFDVISDIEVAFNRAWNTNKTGKRLIEAIFRTLTRINNLLTSIGNAFRDAWNDERGVEITTLILEIVTGIFDVIGELAERLREAWEANENGIGIWEGILNIVGTVLGFINRIIEATRIWLENLDLEPAISGFNGLLESINPVISAISNGLQWAYENVILPFGSWLLELVVPEALELLSAAFDSISTILEILQPHAEWIWEEFLQPLAEWTGELIIAAIQKLTEVFTKFSDWARENPEKFKTIFDTIVAGLAAIWVYVTVKNIVAWTTLSLIPALTSLASVLFGVILPVGILTYAIIELFKNWDKLSPAEQTITILGALAAAATAAAIAIAIFHTAWTVGLAAAAIAAGVAIIASISYFSGKDVSLNYGSGGGGSRSGSIPSSASSFAAHDFGSSPLPALATGSVVPPNSEFLAILGDNKNEPEIVSPLSTMRQAVMEAIEASGGSEQIVEVHSHIYLDGKEIFESVERESSRRGVRMVRGGGIP